MKVLVYVQCEIQFNFSNLLLFSPNAHFCIDLFNLPFTSLLSNHEVVLTLGCKGINSLDSPHLTRLSFRWKPVTTVARFTKKTKRMRRGVNRECG